MAISGFRRLSTFVVLLAQVFLPSAIWAEKSTLVPDTALKNGGLVWIVPGGHSVHIDPPEVHIDGQTGSPLKFKKQSVEEKTTLLEYAVSLNPSEGKTDGYRSDMNIDYPYGFDMSLSDGWSDTGYPPTGPARMPADILAEVVERFQRRTEEGPPRPKLKEIEGLDSLVRPIP